MVSKIPINQIRYRTYPGLLEREVSSCQQFLCRGAHQLFISMASYVRVSTETCRRNLSIADAQSSYAAQRLNFHPMENSGGFNQSLISSHCRVTFILGIPNARTAVHVQSSITPVTGRIIHVLTKSYFISIPGNHLI